MKLLLIALGWGLLACTNTQPQVEPPLHQQGIASFYSVKSNGGTATASGIPFSNEKLTAAHKKLPMGTKVRVVCTETEEDVVVTITDRGPYVKGRVIDLSPAAAQEIGLTPKMGLKKVELYLEED